MDPATVAAVSNTNSSDPFCLAPQSFIRNTGSNTAVLMSDSFNGTQSEHAGNYTCFVNGVPRATIEIFVLGNSYFVFFL